MDSLISVGNVSKSFGKVAVIEDINFEITEPEIFGLLGPSGAGKTTLVKIIGGIDEATSGKVLLWGQSMPDLKLMGQIGYMAQADALYIELSAKENLVFFGKLYGLKGKRLHERIDHVMGIVGMKNDLHKRVSEYSGGMKRRLSLAIALLHEPKLLILDEPTVGIDPVLRQSIWKEFNILKGMGIPILVTTHVMDEADKCDRLGMIRDGKLIAVGTPADLIKETKTTTIEEAFLQYGGVS